MKVRLAIVTAYRALPGAEDVLRLQAECLRQFTPPGEFEVVCAMEGLPAELERDLRALLPMIEVPASFPGVSGGAQHGLFLDRLVAEALAQDFEWICVLDPDCFPIRPGWLEAVRGWLREGAEVVAMVRSENGDTLLPHPAFTCFQVSLMRRHPFSFMPFVSAAGGAAASGQAPDVGIGLAECLSANRLPWRKLARSNRQNDHYLLAGVYENLVFHLGGVARTGLIFRGDLQRSVRLRLYHHHYRRLNLRWPNWRRQRVKALEFLLDASLGFPRRSTERINRRAADAILRRLLERKLEYVRELAGAPS